MDSSQKDIIIEIVEGNFTLNYSYYAVIAFLLYDTALLFEDEVKYILQPPKNALSYLYFITRYGGILYAILQVIWNTNNATPTICHAFYISGLLGPLLILCTDYILLLRVQAIYSKGRTITIILVTAFAIEGIIGIALAMQGVITLNPQPEEVLPGLIYCFLSTRGFVEDVVSWCIPLVFGVFLLVLAVYKCARILKEDPGLSTIQIVRIIVRDQVVYFMALIVISAGAILDVNLSSKAVMILESSFGNPAILSSVSARLLINMKEVGAKGLIEGMGTNVSKTTVSGIDFAVRLAQTSDVSRVDADDLEGLSEGIEMAEV